MTSPRPSGQPADLGAAAWSSAPAATALAAFDLLTVAGMGRLFQGAGWIVPVLGSAAAAHVVGWSARRARLALWLAAPLSMLAVLIVLVWSVLGAGTWYGIPTPHTFALLGHDLAGARAAFSTLTAPVPTLAGFLIVAGAGAGFMAVLADWAAFRLQTMLEAVVPAVAVLVFVSVLAPHPPGGVWTGAFVALLAAFVAIHENGRRAVAAFRFTGGGGNRPWLTRAGTTMAVVTAVGAAIIGPHLPGAGSTGLVTFRHHGASVSSQRTTISPLVDIRSRLVSESNTELFTVQSGVAAYWRLTSLDHFDGIIWSSNESYAPASGALPSILPRGGRSPIAQTYSIEGLDSIWLPAAYIPTRLSQATGVSWDPVSESLISRDSTSDGQVYSVTSEEPLLGPSLLRQARASSEDPAVAARYTQLPPDVPADVVALAHRITAGARTPFDRALSLQNYLRDNYRYSLVAQAGHSNSAIEDFLFRNRTGYCEQFAGAYAVMARAIGLPTRVAVGFTPGQLQSGVWHVFGADAHAWPEVLLGQYGWVPFEPTPGRGNPGASSYTGVAPAQAQVGGNPGTTVTTAASPSPSTVPPPARRLNLQESGAGAHSHLAGRPRVALITFLVLLALGLLWVVGVPAARRVRRAARRRRAEGDRERILVAWEEARGWLDLAGLDRRADETYLEHAGRAGGTLGMDEEALSALSHLAAQASAAAYGPGDHSEGGAASARQRALQVERAVVDSQGRWHILGRELDPRRLTRV